MKRSTFIPAGLAIGFFALGIGSAASASTGTLNIIADAILTEDHFGNIIIDAGGVTLDCAGYSVQGDGTGIGILLEGQSGVTIKRCVVVGFFQGVAVENSYDSTFFGNTVTQNVQIGIRLVSSHHNRITGNRITDNSSGELMSGATALIIGEGSANNLVSLNTVTGNESTGIVVADDGSNWNSIIGNVSADNGAKGFDIIGVSRNLFKGNFVVRNGEFGFHVRGGSEFNFFVLNFACQNVPLDVLDEHVTEGGRGNFWIRNLFCTSQGI